MKLTSAVSINEKVRKLQSMFFREPNDNPNELLLGKIKGKETRIRIPHAVRTMHTQVIGTTNAGKTASVILPWLVQDIAQGRGAIVIDGKADKAFLDTFISHTKNNGREDDFVLFSLAIPGASKSYNPFENGTPEQIAERAIAAFKFENEYYRNIQFQVLRTVITLIQARKKVPTPFLVRELIRDPSLLKEWSAEITDVALLREIEAITNDKEDKRLEKVSGLISALTHFSTGESRALFNKIPSEIDFKEIINKKKLCYFQLPTMMYPFLGESAGKLILQNLQSAISEIQISGRQSDSVFTIFLDDFNDYIYPGFASILNKSRSANIGVVFSHQSLGDLEKVGPEFKQIVLTNTNIKIIMRSNDPDTAEYFAKMIGTKEGQAATKRRSKLWFWKKETGEESVRDVEEFVYHPNIFKSKLGTGEAICILPHSTGSSVVELKMSMAPDPKKNQSSLIVSNTNSFDPEYQLERKEKKEVKGGKKKKAQKPKLASSDDVEFPAA